MSRVVRRSTPHHLIAFFLISQDAIDGDVLPLTWRKSTPGLVKRSRRRTNCRQPWPSETPPLFGTCCVAIRGPRKLSPRSRRSSGQTNSRYINHRLANPIDPEVLFD